jgi:hypothetical protein
VFTLRIASPDEIPGCAERYRAYAMAKGLPFTVDRARATASLFNSDYFRIISRDGRDVGFISATVGCFGFSTERVLNQNFYFSELEGYSAHLAVKIAHEGLLEFARTARVKKVVSGGSYLDGDFVFVRLLERLGWTRHAHVAVKSA